MVFASCADRAIGRRLRWVIECIPGRAAQRPSEEFRRLGLRRAPPWKHRRPAATQILPLTSFCTRLAISTRRRQACSRNDITRSMSRSLGSGISILRSPSATFGSGGFSESAFGSGFVDLAGDGRFARRQFSLELFVVGLQPADFRIERRAFVRHGVAGPAGAGVAAGRDLAGPGIEADHAIGRPATGCSGRSRRPASARAAAAPIPTRQSDRRDAKLENFEGDAAVIMGVLRLKTADAASPTRYTCER